MGLFIVWKTSEISNLLLSRLYSLGWSIQHDKELKSNLRKSQKLSYLALLPGNNKQNVPSALETTITTARRKMSAGRFLNNLREVLNSKSILQYYSLTKENKVTTGNVAKKLINWSHCESCKILLKAGNVDIANNA